MRLFFTDFSGVQSPEALLAQMLPRLSCERRGIVLRRRKEQQLISAGAALLLSYAAGAVFGCPSPDICWEGKPSFRRLPYACSITHTDTLAAVLIGTAPCGVDAEELLLPRNTGRMAKRLFPHPEEQRFLKEHADDPSAFFRLWTAKEAALKYTGEGFSRPMSSVCADPDRNTARLLPENIRCDLRFISVRRTVLCACAAALPKTMQAEPISPFDL